MRYERGQCVQVVLQDTPTGTQVNATDVGQTNDVLYSDQSFKLGKQAFKIMRVTQVNL